MKFLTLCLISILCIKNLSAQELIQVVDTTLTLNAASSSANARVKTKLIIPDKASGYIYRLSIFPKNKTYADNFLINKGSNLNVCKTMLNSKASCDALKDCMGKEIYFGFQTIMQKKELM